MLDVAIVGAGPVGLFTALLLARSGLQVEVFERWPTFYPLPRACGIDHEVIRLLQGADLAEALEPLLDPVIGPEKTYEFLDSSGETLLQIDWNRPGLSGWAQMNLFYQPDLERMFVEQLEGLENVKITRSVELVDLMQGQGRVSLTFQAVEEPADKIFVQARYVIGADGARSTVRDQIGSSLIDLGFEYDWLVVDVIPNSERVWKPYVVQHCDPSRPTTCVGSGPGRRRWEFMRLPHESASELSAEAKVWELLSPWGITAENAELERHTVYTFRGAWADKWSRGNVFLVGDAAHLMPPFLAQGLCSGMRDAKAIAWRIDLVSRGLANESLFESYGLERSGHVQEIVRQAVEIGKLICALDPEEASMRDAAMKSALADPNAKPTPPPEPRLGFSSITSPEIAASGLLSPQGRVRYGGRTGLFDDVVGKGWQLIIRDGAGPIKFNRNSRQVIQQLNIVVARFGADGGIEDLDGVYERWFESTNCDLILVRPDLFIFSTGKSGEADQLITSLSASISLSGPTEESRFIEGTDENA